MWTGYRLEIQDVTIIICGTDPESVIYIKLGS